jgi:dTDP-4-amino-4,6-dideoxygalactose transaminase
VPIQSPVFNIPAEDLTRQYQQIRWEIAATVDKVLPSGKYTLGPILEYFENEFAHYCEVKHCTGISNGTEALHLALKAWKIGPGDEVITQANTYVATAFAISYCGAKPVFVDIEPDYFNMDVSKLEALINEHTRAIIPVHLYGQPVDMDPLMNLAAKYGLKVLEDGSHAQGALYKNRKTGSLGHAAAISFYPSKNLGAYGDAGGIVTNDDDFDHQVRILRYMGQEEKHTHQVIGFQQRLDPIQAAILSVKLRYLDIWNENRRKIAAQYNSLLADLPITLPKVADYAKHVYYMYTIRTPRRDALMDYLTDYGIGSQKIYATPVPMQPCYKELGYKEDDIPVSVNCANELLCLPVFPELREDEVQIISNVIHQFFNENKL